MSLASGMNYAGPAAHKLRDLIPISRNFPPRTVSIASKATVAGLETEPLGQTHRLLRGCRWLGVRANTF